MRKWRVLCSSLMLSLVASSMVLSDVGVYVKAAITESVDEEEDGETIYYSEEDGVKLTDLYDGVVGEDVFLPLNDDRDIAPIAVLRLYGFPSSNVSPGKIAVYRSLIYYTTKRDVTIEFTPDRTGTLVVGLRSDSTDNVILSKEVSCTANKRKTVKIELFTGILANAYILNNTGQSVRITNPTVTFVCEL